MKYFIFIAALLMIPAMVHAQIDLPVTDAYLRTEIQGISADEAEVTVKIIDGETAGELITLQNIYHHSNAPLQKGETVIVQRFSQPSGEMAYLMGERYRFPSIVLLTLLFFLLGILLGGRIGFTSILGLSASIAIIIFFVVPQIIAGSNPLLISLVGSILIACSSLYLAHGFNRRTSIALLSTIITLLLSTILAVVFVYFGKLFGMGTEQSVFLQIETFEQVNLRGLLLGGIIIGALGVLDDITTAQTASIDEIAKANHSLGFKELYASGTSIGREHIASLINSLALAYVGASLPLLLLFSIDTHMPWWMVINSEFIAEEIVRTLVGSSTLLLAVPISTWIAAKKFAYGNHTNATGHAHVH